MRVQFSANAITNLLFDWENCERLRANFHYRAN